jgi:hypothetical protein
LGKKLNDCSKQHLTFSPFSDTLISIQKDVLNKAEIKEKKERKLIK